LFFDLTESYDQGFRVFALDIIPAVIENIDDGVVLQPQHGAGIERKTMLDGDLHTYLRDDGFSLLKSHNTRPLTLMSTLRGVNPDFTLASLCLWFVGRDPYIDGNDIGCGFYLLRGRGELME
jgi:hypothetical protein